MHAALQLTEHPEDGAAVVRLLPLDLRDAPVEAAPSVAGDCRHRGGRGRVVDGRLQKEEERSLYCD